MPSVSEIASVGEAAEVLSRAAAEGTRVSIEREGGDVVVSTARLDQVVEHEAGDLTCIVEAGVRVRDLNARLADHGQMLALDPPGNPTIGACVAANLSGPRRHRYGTARDLVIGVTVVLGDGTPFFPALDEKVDLELVETRTFGGRVVYLRYRRASD